MLKTTAKRKNLPKIDPKIYGFSGCEIAVSLWRKAFF